MATYTILADVVEADLQNVQEWLTTFGDVRETIQQHDGELVDAYAVLGDYDFQFIYEAEDEEAAVQIAIALGRHGLNTSTHPLLIARQRQYQFDYIQKSPVTDTHTVD